MKFRRHASDDPEINLIPFIDVLLVVLIFLMLSTTYSKFTELQVTLPLADAEKLRERDAEIVVLVAADGRCVVGRQAVAGRSVESLTAALTAQAARLRDPVVVISADAKASHQAVIDVMDAARRAGLQKLSFASQRPGGAPAR